VRSSKKMWSYSTPTDQFGAKTLFSRRRFLDLLSDAIDDVCRSICVANDTGERFPDLVQVERLHLQKILGRPGVVARAGDRLRNFVGQRGGQLSHHAHAVHVGEIRFHLLQPRQRLCAILDVREEKIPTNNAPRIIPNWDAADVKPPVFAVEAP
jgi:hypothetical protein